MSYSSYTYLFVFLVGAFLLYTITPKKIKWVSLLACSYVFYVFTSKELTVFLLFSTVTIYLGGLLLNRIQDKFDAKRKLLEKEERKALKASTQNKKRLCVAAILTLNFGVLIILKYWNFLCGTADGIVGLFGASISCYPVKVALPLGISFYTLQAVSYIIDVYRCKYKATKNFGKIALFLSFFPQITEGPIGRFDLIGDQLYEGHKFDYDRVLYGIELILWGLLKKIVIADRANAFVGSVFDSFALYNGFTIVLAVLMYTLQLYAEFSGCMDIVTGSAQLFGVTLQKNFDRPFFSQSINEFWRRWHITLGLWLKDYVFYSVSLSKGFMNLSKWTRKHFNDFFANLVPAAFALFFVWFGNGFWHGSGWKYITYGLYYYVIMMLGMLCEPLFKKLFNKVKIKRDGTPMKVFRILRTFILVNIGMMMFRADTLTSFFNMFGRMFVGNFFRGISDNTILSLGLDYKDFIVLGVGLALMIIISTFQEKGHKIRAEIAAKPLVLKWAVYMALIVGIIVFGAYGEGYGVVDFIYGQF